MVFRFDTTCPRCNKPDSVYGLDQVCKDCRLKGFFKSQIRAGLRERKFRKELLEMKKEIKEKLHKELLKEIMDEENKK